MVTLYLLRHAKSDWDHPDLADHDRPLAKRGTRAAKTMGRRIAALGIRPDLILCSTARRTRDTLKRVLKAGALEDVPVTFSDSLYGASASDLIDIVRAEGHGHSSILLIGHNPGFQDCALALSGSGDAALLDRLEYKLPTGSLVGIEFTDGDFATIAPGHGRLTLFERPADQTTS